MSEKHVLQNLKARIIKRHLVNNDEIKQMYTLITRYFEHMKFQVFKKDFQQKDWIIILISNDNTIFGFSTIQLINTTLGGEKLLYIYSGDTIVDKEFWQANMLVPSFGLFMLKSIKKNPDKKIYWYLITKGYKTYRLLQVYFKKYYPCFKMNAPPDYTDKLNHISCLKYKDNYNAVTGIISHNGEKDCLNPMMAKVPESKKKNPATRFFLKKNPNYIQGDELACLAEVSRNNLTPLFYRIIENRTVEWIE